MSKSNGAPADWRERGTVLVTGASGFTGSHLTHALLDRGAQVRAMVRDLARGAELEEHGAELVVGDVRSTEDLERAIDGTSVIFHIAALFRDASRPKSEYIEVNTESPRRVVEIAATAGVQRVVHCSTIGVYGDVGEELAGEDTRFAPGDVYQETKLEGELAAVGAASDLRLPLTVVRPATIYGPGDRRMLKLFGNVARRRFPILGSGEVKLHPVYIDDLVEGMLLAATNDAGIGRSYILGGSEALSLNEIVRTVAELCDVPPPRLRLPAWPFWLAGAVCEAVCVPLRIDPPLYRRRVAFFTKSRSFDISRAQLELGYAPKVDWRTGAERTLQWYRAAGWM